MRSYELMYILDPTLDEDASTALVSKIEGLMSKQGVELEKTEPWGKRRLAYPIKGHWDGNYVLSYLKAPADAISEMERRLRVTDGILRFLTVRLDEEQAKLERRKSRRDEKDRARRSRRAARQGEGAETGSGSEPRAESASPPAEAASGAAESAPEEKPSTAPPAESAE